jgi:hypothetical protein
MGQKLRKVFRLVGSDRSRFAVELPPYSADRICDPQILARKSAPDRTRTCDPRLRRAVACGGTGFHGSDLRRYPRGLPTRSD